MEVSAIPKTNERTQTIRQEVTKLLEKGPVTVRQISQAVGVMEKDVFYHLEFIAKTVRHQKKRIRVEPYYCRDCGFQFKDRRRYGKPGRCPECRNGRIASARFWIDF